VNQCGERVHVVALEGVDVARDQRVLLAGERVGDGFRHAAFGEGRARPLQRAVRGGNRDLEALGHLRGRPAEHLRQQQHGALLRRQVLERRHEGQADALPQHRALGGVGVGGHGQRVRDGLDPV
jgi:hypothetical protein